MIVDFIRYLLYGLAFFTLGVAILSRDVRFSELGIAKIIWLLAIFGIIHSFHEWLELLEHLAPAIRTSPSSLFRIIVVSISFLFLLYFGLFLSILIFYGDQALKTTQKFIQTLISISGTGSAWFNSQPSLISKHFQKTFLCLQHLRLLLELLCLCNGCEQNCEKSISYNRSCSRSTFLA